MDTDTELDTSEALSTLVPRALLRGPFLALAVALANVVHPAAT